MVEVEKLFYGPDYKTQVWYSAAVREALGSLQGSKQDNTAHMLKKLEHCAKAGFALFEGDDRYIRHEWDGVYRFGLHGSLFRIYGFYEDQRRSSFIAIDAFTKSKQKLNRAEQKRIQKVAEITLGQDWRRI